MPYEANEIAHEDAIELFRFSRGGYFWRFTDAEIPITKDGEVFRPEPVMRSSIKMSEEQDSAQVEITLPARNQVSRLFSLPYLHSGNVWVTIMRLHRNELTEVPAFIFTGEVVSARFEGPAAIITCRPMRNSIHRVIPIQLMGDLCSNTLYDIRCRVDPALFSNACTVTAVNGNTLTVTGIAARATGFFDGGYVYVPSLQHTTILTHIAPDQITLMQNPGYMITDTLTAYAGCDKKLSTCRDKFNNTPNHQGFRYFPTLDPFKDGVD